MINTHEQLALEFHDVIKLKCHHYAYNDRTIKIDKTCKTLIIGMIKNDKNIIIPNNIQYLILLIDSSETMVIPKSVKKIFFECRNHLKYKYHKRIHVITSMHNVLDIHKYI